MLKHKIYQEIKRESFYFPQYLVFYHRVTLQDPYGNNTIVWMNATNGILEEANDLESLYLSYIK